MKWKLYQFDTVSSTNEIAKSYGPWCAVRARRQTRGKGRMGREWVSPEGNLYLSVVLPEAGEKTHLVSFVAAVAVAETLRSFDVRLKWPNDVLLDGGKVCGILSERSDEKIIVGIGVNAHICPEGVFLYKTACLKGQMSLEALTQGILEHLARLWDMFLKQGFAPIREKWMFYATGLGQKMTVRLPDRNLEGFFETMDSAGMLHLKCLDGSLKKIAAGDVFIEGKKEDEQKEK